MWDEEHGGQQIPKISREAGWFKEIVVEYRRRRLRFHSSIISKIVATRTYAVYQIQGYGATLKNKSLECVHRRNVGLEAISRPMSSISVRAHDDLLCWLLHDQHEPK